MNDQKNVVSISTARKKIMGPIMVDGVEHDVRQLDFGTNHRIGEAEGSARYLDVIRDAVRTVCPTLSVEQVDAMGLDEGQVILLYAGAGIEAVEKMFPNVVSPGTVTLTSPG